jgi:hypothetical protein
MMSPYILIALGIYMIVCDVIAHGIGFLIRKTIEYHEHATTTTSPKDIKSVKVHFDFSALFAIAFIVIGIYEL